jgi:pyrroloquinoline-quinone synthase
MTPGEFRDSLRAVCEANYHHRHPFNALMHAGALSPEQLRLWVSNRYYYQTRIPIKDALILAKCDDPEFRRSWLRRIQDHDGKSAGEGGLELWLRLATTVGLPRDRVQSLEQVLPEVRQAADDYVNLVANASLVEAVAASLTEQFAGSLMQTRLKAWQERYPWVDRAGLEYFRVRSECAPVDAEEALAFVERVATAADAQGRCRVALAAKCSILWRMLDAIYAASIRRARPKLASRARLRWDGVASRWLLLAPEKALVLNGTAADILQQSTGTMSFEQIVDQLCNKYVGRSRPEIENEAASLLANLQARALMAVEG